MSSSSGSYKLLSSEGTDNHERSTKRIIGNRVDDNDDDDNGDDIEDGETINDGSVVASNVLVPITRRPTSARD